VELTNKFEFSQIQNYLKQHKHLTLVFMHNNMGYDERNTNLLVFKKYPYSRRFRLTPEIRIFWVFLANTGVQTNFYNYSFKIQSLQDDKFMNNHALLNLNSEFVCTEKPTFVESQVTYIHMFCSETLLRN
jgi:hypothetical protein